MSDKPRATDAYTEPVGGPDTVSYGLRISVVTGPDAGSRASITAGGVRVGSEPECELVLADRKVSRHHVTLKPHPAGVSVADQESLNGTFVADVRISEAVVPPGTLVCVGNTELLIEPDIEAVASPVSKRHVLGPLVGRSAAMRRAFAVIERVAPTDYTVLIEGETGTGKQTAARTIHELSPRRSHPLEAIDCTAGDVQALDDALFGTAAGSDPATCGALQRARGGTLFLAGIDKLPAEVQGKLAQAVENGRVNEPVTGDPINIDVRLVVASDAPLSEAVKANTFREDLFYRLSVVKIPMPPLRTRREDIPMLVEAFVRTADVVGDIRGANLDRLVGYDWPGNVRELRATLERALAMTGGGRVEFSDLPISLGDASPTMSWPIGLDMPFREAKDHLVTAFERVYASRLLELVDGNVSEAARRSGLSRRHFFELAKKHNMLPSQASDDDDE